MTKMMLLSFALAADPSLEGPYSVPMRTAVLNCTTTAVWVSRERNGSGYVTDVDNAELDIQVN